MGISHGLLSLLTGMLMILQNLQIHGSSLLFWRLQVPGTAHISKVWHAHPHQHIDMAKHAPLPSPLPPEKGPVTAGGHQDCQLGTQGLWPPLKETPESVQGGIPQPTTVRRVSCQVSTMVDLSTRVCNGHHPHQLHHSPPFLHLSLHTMRALRHLQEVGPDHPLAR